MPELPEVETLRRRLAPFLVGRRVTGIRVDEPRLRYPVDGRALRRLVQGSRVRSLSRRAKYLIIELDGKSRLIVHLGMSGGLQLARPDEPRKPHVHLVFSLDDGTELRYRDPRRFGFVEATGISPLDDHRFFRHLGVEPLGEACSADYLHRRSRNVRRAVKGFIMDATIVVGIGNIYASEALFRARIHPARAAGRISRDSWHRLDEAIKDVLTSAVARGGSSIRDFHHPDGTSGDFQTTHQVYDRSGEPCPRCARPIRRRIISSRSTFYCPTCQH